MIDLSSVFPIRAIAEDCLVNRNMDVTAGFSLKLPEFASLGDDNYRTLHDYLAQVLKRQPTGTCIHFQNVYYQVPFTKEYYGDSIIEKENYRYFFERPIMRHYSNLYVTYSNQTLKKVNAMNSSFMRVLNYTASNPLKDVDKVVAKYKKNIAPFLSDLNQSGMIKGRRMGEDELRASLYDYFSQVIESPCPPGEAGKREIPQMEIVDGYLRVGDRFVAILSLTSEGAKLVSSKAMNNLPRENAEGVRVPQGKNLPASMSYPLGLGLPFNHIYNVAIEVVDNHIAKSVIENSKYGLNVLGSFVLEAQKKNEESKAFLNSMAEYHYQACRVSVNVVLSDSILANLKEKVTFTANAFQRMNDSSVFAENFDAANLFFCSCPGNFKANYRTAMETVDQAVCYIPKETVYHHDPTGVTFVTPFGEPCVVNVYNPPGANNRNAVFFGPSGTGKSVALNHLTDQFLLGGCSVFIVDVSGSTHASYKRNAEINGGKYLDSSSAKNFQFNPFLCKQDSRGNYLFEPVDNGEDGEDVLVKDFVINSIYANLAAIINNKKITTPEVKAVLKKSIRSFYQVVNEKKIFPSVTEYFEFTKHYEEKILESEYKEFINFNAIRLLLEPFAHGSYRNLLNSKSINELKGEKFVVAELKAILADDTLREIVFVNIINLINNLVEAGGFRYFYAILDEVVDYLKGDFGDFIGGFFRKIRKDGGGVFATTQGIDYLDQIDPLVKASILSNCDYKFLTDHKNYTNLYGSLQRDLSLTPFDMELLHSLEGDSTSREIFLKVGNRSRKYRIELSPFSYGVYNTEPKDVEAIYSFYEKIGSMPAAINSFIDQKYKKNLVKK